MTVIDNCFCFYAPSAMTVISGQCAFGEGCETVLRNGVKEAVDVLGSPSLIASTVSVTVDLKQH